MLSQIVSWAFDTYMDSGVAAYHPSPLRLRLSSIAGSTSLACWFVLSLPQLIEQWRLKSVEGISVYFLLIWATGDLANLIGSLSAGLLPEVIWTAVWFFFSDGFILCFYYYFAVIYPKRHPHLKKNAPNGFHDPEQPTLGQSEAADEHTALLSEHNLEHNLIDVEGRRRASHKSRTSSRRRRSSVIEDIIMDPEDHSIFVRYVLPIGFIFLCGLVGSFCSPNKLPDDGSDVPDGKIQLFPQICGYISAILYLTARLPQIYKNYKKKSCKGLSLLFFMLSTLGNTTFGLQILFYRNDAAYLKLNSSWLLGSLGTITEDVIIFYQFYIYNKSDSNTATVFDE